MKHEPRQVVHMEKPLETAWVGPKVELGRGSENHQSGTNHNRQANGESDMAPVCWLCWGRSQKRNSGL